MAKIAIATLRALINYLTKNDLYANKPNKLFRSNILSHLDISEEKLSQCKLLVDSELYEKLFILAEKTFHHEIGFEFGKTITPDRWGILGYIAFTSPTLKIALQQQRKYQSLAGNFGSPLSETHNNSLVLKWIPAYQCNHHIVEEVITGWIALANKLSPIKIKPRVIYFQHSFKGHQQTKQDYQLYFDCPVAFDHDFNGIEIEQSSLELPLVTRDDIINTTLCEQADKMLECIISQSPIESVNQYIINQLPFGVPEIDDVAKQLGMSIRTLQRKLSENELNFTGMVDTIRKDLALSYLKNTQTKIIYISQMLGFSEQSAFQRAFKRWVGVTPKQYRESN